MNETVLYEIRFKGHLDSYRAQMFEGLEMVQEPGGETLVTGSVADQAALHGLLAKIRDLNLILISVNHIEPDGEQP